MKNKASPALQSKKENAWKPVCLIPFKLLLCQIQTGRLQSEKPQASRLFHQDKLQSGVRQIRKR